MILAIASAAVYATVFAYVVTIDAAVVAGTIGLGVIGALLLLLVLWRREDELIVWALACLGAAYALGLVAHGGAVDDAAPLVAAGLLGCGELAAWSLQERHRVSASFDFVVQRGAWAVGLVAAGTVAASIVLALSAVPTGRSFVWTLLGAASAVAVLALAARLATKN